MRGLGIPTVVDRIIQQAAALILDRIFDPHFSEFSYGFRRDKSAHKAVFQALEYLNEGYQWVVDLDIEKFFDNVNHDKLISLVRKEVNDKPTLHLIRKFLKAGVMENGVEMETDKGTPQGSPVSPILSLIYLNELDWELEKRGLPFARYADDFLVMAKSEKSRQPDHEIGQRLDRAQVIPKSKSNQDESRAPVGQPVPWLYVPETQGHMAV